MKLLKMFYIFFYAILLLTSSHAQSSLSAQGMAPLGINNYWVYKYPSGGINIWYVKQNTIQIDSIVYNILSPIKPHYVRLREDGYYVLRRDSTYNEPNHEEIYYKKDAQLGDIWTQLMYGSDIYTYPSEVTGTFPLQIFDTLVTGKVVRKDLGLVLLDELWTEEFGIISTADYTGVMDYLAGCVIDGVVYGDTSTTSVKYEQLEILPESIELSQNYPNPFNPVTNIEYILPEENQVKIIVYNTLGEQVAVLVNELQASGKYIVQFSTRKIGNLSSGVYFYTLKTGKSMVTKKMVLLQ